MRVCVAVTPACAVTPAMWHQLAACVGAAACYMRQDACTEAPVVSAELLVVECKLTETRDKKVEVKLKRWQLTASQTKWFACFNMDPWTDSDEPLYLLPGEETKTFNLQGELYTKSTGWVEFTTKCDQKVSVASMMQVLPPS